MNTLFFRFYQQHTPKVKLSQQQLHALEEFKLKLKNGVYHFVDVPCLCGNKSGKLIAHRDRYGLPVHTHLCKLCGTMWTSPRMTEDSLSDFYNIDYRPIYVGTQIAKEDFFAEQIQHGRRIYKFVSSEMNNTQQPIVFDVGCGAGGALIPFAEASWSTFGCDLGGDFLERGRKSGLVLKQGDINVLKEHGLASLVILSHVLEHFPDPLHSIQQISRSLTSDGYVYVELPGIFSIHETYGDLMRFLQNAHLYHFTLTTLTSLMSKVGFRLVKGNEEIYALFQKDNTTMICSSSGEFQRISKYLYFIELVRIIKHYRFVYYPYRLGLKMIRRIFGNDCVNGIKNRMAWPSE